MYNNIGNILKTTALIILIVGIAGALIGGFIMITNGLGGAGAAVLIGGCIVTWLTSITLFGFGRIVENSDTIAMVLKQNKAGHIEEDDETVFSGQTEENAADPFRYTKTGQCELCGANDVGIAECRISDKMGIRYRNICERCMKKTGAKLV